MAHRDELLETLGERLRTAGADSSVRLLPAAGVPAGPPVNTLDEAFAFADRLGLPGIVAVPAPAGGAESRQVACPVTLSGSPARCRLPPAAPGKHKGASRLAPGA
ncbi:formyl-CoA transferase [Streptomyces azureus]|uniref:Formyl-CoA transferase n=1 Tax=Streptomyces azureus TaxID=146537 RepID=A0A0K8PE11_STRAJ|nr:formyl-CoA transferase [Streptomyces azureus]